MADRNQQIINEFLSDFPFLEKDNYIWELESGNGEKEKNIVFYGTNINDNNNVIYVKRIFIKFKDTDKNNHKQIFKEIYFTFFFQKYYYFLNKVDKLFSKNEEFLFLIFKDNNTISLKRLINSKEKDYLNNNPNLIKWIIYQIAFGLYTLHSNNIIHFDIKPSNILINKVGGIFIIDFGSAIFKGENYYSYTSSHASPEFLINHVNDEKYDIWSLGITMIELYLKDYSIFNNIKDKKKQLDEIFTKFGIKDKYTNEDLIKELNDNKKIKFQIDKNILAKINDKNAKDLLKNLLTFSPKERFTAKNVLDSKYLKEYKGIDSFELKKNNILKTYPEILENPIKHKDFLKLIREIEK